MSNIYLKVINEEKNWPFSFKKFFANVSFRELQHKKISLNFKTSRCNLKIRDLEAKMCVTFYCFHFIRSYDVLNSKSQSTVLNKKHKI